MRRSVLLRARIVVIVLGTALAVVLVVGGAVAAESRGALASPGWAAEGSPSSPASQFAADAKYASAECAENTLLLYRVRGSGELPGSDKLGYWASALGAAAIAKGWRVRDLQASYEAPKVPLDEVVHSVYSLNPAISAVKIWKALATYRDVAKISWPAMKSTLVTAYHRCPQRRIAVSGYSQGALVLRYLVRNLPPEVRAQIVEVDLVGDPTADKTVDVPLRHPSQLNGRVTNGVDTTATRLINGFFHQTAYPADISAKTAQLCAPYDLVCDFNAVNVAAYARNAHGHYDWSGVGRFAASSLRSWLSVLSPPVAPPITATTTTPPPPASTTTARPAPTTSSTTTTTAGTTTRVTRIWLCSTEYNPADCKADVTTEAPEPNAPLTCSVWISNGGGSPVSVTFTDTATGQSASVTSSALTGDAVVTAHTQIRELPHVFTCSVSAGGVVIGSRSLKFTA